MFFYWKSYWRNI